MTLNYFPHAVWQDINERTNDSASRQESKSMKSMRERFYGPIVNQTVMYLDVLTNSQFVSIFQGLCICGPIVLKTEAALNAVLNQFIQRL